VRIGIVCYASTGGSGIVATELAVELADVDHAVADCDPAKLATGRLCRQVDNTSCIARRVDVGDIVRRHAQRGTVGQNRGHPIVENGVQ